jgi:hypothetical protein
MGLKEIRHEGADEVYVAQYSDMWQAGECGNEL